MVEVSYPACPGPRDKVPGAFFKYLLKCFNKYQLKYSKRYLLKYSYNTESHCRFDFIGSQGFQVVGAPFILVRTVIITISFTTVIINIMIFIIAIIITTRPKPAYGRQGLAGLWGQDTDQGGTFWDVLNVSLRASGTQLS